MIENELTVTFNNDPESTQFIEPTPRIVTLNLSSAAARCTRCGDELHRREEDQRWADTGGNVECGDSEPADPDAPISTGNPEYGRGPHSAAPMPLAWCSDVEVELDSENDTGEVVDVTVTMDNGQAGLRIQRYAADHSDPTLAGRTHIMLATPSNAQPYGDDGYLVG